MPSGMDIRGGPHELCMQSVLITGGAGFIGSCLVRQWLAHERDRVLTLDRLTYAGNLASLEEVLDHPRHVFCQGDIGDASLVAGLLEKHRPRAVIHLAAESHVDRSIDDPAPFVTTNVMGTARLLDAVRAHWENLPADARGSFRFLHVSTDEVYGSLEPGQAAGEQSRYDPSSPYAASKAAGDHFARSFQRTYGLPVIVTNCTNNYGPRQFPEKLIPLMILNALDGRPLPVYGDGRHVRDWLHVEDHCRALRCVLAGGQPGHTYHVAGGGERTNLEVVEAICAAVAELAATDGAPRPAPQITFVPDRPGHDRRYVLDWSKLREELKWRPERDFAAGIRQTVRWYFDHGDWVHAVTAGKYDRQRLGQGGSRD